MRVREISDDEGNRLKRIVRRGSGSVVTWRRAQMVLWSAQGMSVPQIAVLAFTSQDRVRDVLHDFNADGFDSLYTRYAGGHPPVFTLAQRREIKKIAKSAPAGHGLPFSRWSLARLAGFLVAEGVVEDISHEGLRELLRAQGVSFQAVRTWKQSDDRTTPPRRPGSSTCTRSPTARSPPGPATRRWSSADELRTAGRCRSAGGRRSARETAASTAPLAAQRITTGGPGISVPTRKARA